MPTFDQAQEAFREDPAVASAQAYLDETIRYYEDGMIGEDTFESATAELARWCVRTDAVLHDIRFDGPWNGGPGETNAPAPGR